MPWIGEPVRPARTLSPEEAYTEYWPLIRKAGEREFNEKVYLTLELSKKRSGGLVWEAVLGTWASRAALEAFGNTAHVALERLLKKLES